MINPQLVRENNQWHKNGLIFSAVLFFLLFFSLSSFCDADPLDAGLVAHYPLDGNSRDSSGNGKDLIASSKGPENSADRLGIPGHAYSFDNLLGDYGEYFFKHADSQIDFPEKEGSLSAWFSVTDDSPGACFTVFSRSYSNWTSVESGPFGARWLFAVCPTYSSIDVYEGTSLSVPFTVSPGQWYFITFTWNASGRNIYMNGTLMAQDSLGVLNDGGNAYDWFFGKHPYGVISKSPATSGKLDDVRIYNRALSATEVQTLWGGLTKPQNLRYTLNNDMLTIEWDAVAGASGYRISLGLQSGNYMGTYDIGGITQIGPFSIGGVSAGTYYFAVKAYNDSQESGYSNEISVLLTGRVGDISISSSDDPLKVSGTYKGNGTAKEVHFSATSEGNGKAKAFYSMSDGSAALSVDLQGEDKGTLTWKGRTIDGYGALTQEEFVAVQELASGDLGRALAMVPLDLSCLAKDKDRAAIAALLMPWQMILKYMIPGRAEKMKDLSQGSACSYYGNTSGAKPSPAVVLLSNEDAVPYVYGFFPFDDQGAIEASFSSSQLLEAAGVPVIDGKLFGPCGSRCRGACGADCPDSCTVKEEFTCIEDDQGNKTGESTRYLVYECGGHAGCEWHDNCFEECLTKYGCGTWGASNCMHNLYNGCDITAAYYFGRANCVTWAIGGGPWDRTLVFKYAQSTGDDPLLCSNEKKYDRLHVRFGLEFLGSSCIGGAYDVRFYDVPLKFDLTWQGAAFKGEAQFVYGDTSGTATVSGFLSADILSTFDFSDVYTYQTGDGSGSTHLKLLNLPLTFSGANSLSLTFGASDSNLRNFITVAESSDQGCAVSGIDYSGQHLTLFEVTFANP